MRRAAGVYQKRTDVPGVGSEPWCGTSGGYSNHKCRCEGCRAEWAAYIAEAMARRASRPVPDGLHGKYTTYFNYRCRCAPCGEARRVYEATRRRRRQAAAS